MFHNGVYSGKGPRTPVDFLGNKEAKRNIPRLIEPPNPELILASISILESLKEKLERERG
jgi:hypothetical protein